MGKLTIRHSIYIFSLTIVQWLRSCQQSTGCLGCLLRSASTSTISGSTDQFTSKHRWASLVCKLLACMPTAHSRSLCFPFAKHFLWRSQQLEFLSSIEAAAFSALFIACPWCHLFCMSCPTHMLRSSKKKNNCRSNVVQTFLTQCTTNEGPRTARIIYLQSLPNFF